MERLAREKIATQQRLAELKNELSQWMDVLEIDRILRQTVQPEDDQASTSTASGEPRSPPSSATVCSELGNSCYLTLLCTAITETISVTHAVVVKVNVSMTSIAR